MVFGKKFFFFILFIARLAANGQRDKSKSKLLDDGCVTTQGRRGESVRIGTLTVAHHNVFLVIRSTWCEILCPSALLLKKRWFQNLSPPGPRKTRVTFGERGSGCSGLVFTRSPSETLGPCRSSCFPRENSFRLCHCNRNLTFRGGSNGGTRCRVGGPVGCPVGW